MWRSWTFQISINVTSRRVGGAGAGTAMGDCCSCFLTFYHIPAQILLLFASRFHTCSVFVLRLMYRCCDILVDHNPEFRSCSSTRMNNMFLRTCHNHVSLVEQTMHCTVKGRSAVICKNLTLIDGQGKEAIMYRAIFFLTRCQLALLP